MGVNRNKIRGYLLFYLTLMEIWSNDDKDKYRHCSMSWLDRVGHYDYSSQCELVLVGRVGHYDYSSQYGELVEWVTMITQ